VKRTNVRDANTRNNFVLWTVTQLSTKPAPNTVAVAFCAFTRVTDAYTINQQWEKCTQILQHWYAVTSTIASGRTFLIQEGQHSELCNICSSKCFRHHVTVLLVWRHYSRNHFQEVLHYLQDTMEECVIGIYMTHDGAQLRIVNAVINPDSPRKEGNLSIN